MTSLFLPLYIDPGTGSMLFSILIGAVATLFFLGKAALLKLKLFFSARKNGVAATDTNYKKYVVYNEGVQYWNVFKPVCDEFEKRRLELTYYTSAEKDPAFEQGYQFVKPEFIGEGNMAFAKLNMLSAGIVLMTTPGLNVYQLKRSRNVGHYSHVLHMPSDATTYRLFGIDYFDSVLLSGDYQAPDLRLLEEQRGLPAKQLVTVGCTYLDTLNEKISTIPKEENHPFTVLVSPSWGPSALLSRYGEALLSPLAETGWRVIVRPHPQSKKSEGALLARLTEKYTGCRNLVWDYERDNIHSMRKADVMVSDFSGIIFDYAFLCGKPVLYVNADMDLRPYDAYDLPDNGRNLWQFRVLRSFATEIRPAMLGGIKAVVEKLSADSVMSAEIEKAKNEAWMHRGQAGKRVADFMVGTVEGDK